MLTSLFIFSHTYLIACFFRYLCGHHRSISCGKAMIMEREATCLIHYWSGKLNRWSHWLHIQLFSLFFFTCYSSKKDNRMLSRSIVLGHTQLLCLFSWLYKPLQVWTGHSRGRRFKIGIWPKWAALFVLSFLERKALFGVRWYSAVTFTELSCHCWTLPARFLKTVFHQHAPPLSSFIHFISKLPVPSARTLLLKNWSWQVKFICACAVLAICLRVDTCACD